MLGRGETRPKTWKREVVGRRGNAFFLCAITEEGKLNRRIKTQKKVNGIGIRTIDGLEERECILPLCDNRGKKA